VLRSALWLVREQGFPVLPVWVRWLWLLQMVLL